MSLIRWLSPLTVPYVTYFSGLPVFPSVSSSTLASYTCPLRPRALFITIMFDSFYRLWTQVYPPKATFDVERDITDLSGRVTIVTGVNQGITYRLCSG